MLYGARYDNVLYVIWCCMWYDTKCYMALLWYVIKCYMWYGTKWKMVLRVTWHQMLHVNGTTYGIHTYGLINETHVGKVSVSSWSQSHYRYSRAMSLDIGLLSFMNICLAIQWKRFWTLFNSYCKVVHTEPEIKNFRQ